MKKITTLTILIFFVLSLFGCSDAKNTTDILTTTQPLYYFTSRLCTGSDITVNCLITESISCLHDYTLHPQQMRAIESAKLVFISGAGLEESFSDILAVAERTTDTSAGILLLCGEGNNEHETTDHNHHHEHDPHIWLSPENARIMSENIYAELCKSYPQHQNLFNENLQSLILDFNALSAYASKQLSNITTREIVTFHDGFSYLADAFDLEILYAIEEESGREASAAELIHLCNLIVDHNIPCIFTEHYGSVSAANIISSEIDIDIYQLDMAMSEGNYFDIMYQNINTLKEALG